MAEIKPHINHISPHGELRLTHISARSQQGFALWLCAMAERVEMNNSRVRRDKEALKGISVIKIRAQ